MLRDKRTRAFAVGTCAVVAAVVCLLLRTHEGDSGKAIIRDVERQSLPQGCRRLGQVEIVRKPFSIHATWELQADVTWADYCVTAADRFRSAGYVEQPRSESKIGFGKTLTGDTLSVVIEVVERNPLRLRVTFAGDPS
jgi:hypothetical protein